MCKETIKNLLHTWDDVKKIQEHCHTKHNLTLEYKLKKGQKCFFLEDKWKNKQQQEP